MTRDGAKDPSVYTVGSHWTAPPPLPPRPRPRPRPRGQAGPAQVLLFLLVSVALGGLTIEAWLIYGLYHPRPTETAFPSASKMIGDAPTPGPPPTKWPRLVEAPPKPLAHLTDGMDAVPHGKYTMTWSQIADPLLYRVAYKDGCLVFQESGYYYVYSKVTFNTEHLVRHSVELRTRYYQGKASITLLKSLQASPPTRSNSFLAGIFHFYKDDAIFVKVHDTSHVARHDSTENVFGAYMI